MTCVLNDPKEVLSKDHVNVLFAGSVQVRDLDGWDIRNRLLCFEDGRQTENHLNLYPDCPDMFVLLDSGAFSAWTKGKIINLDEYVDCIIRHRDVVNHAANLDVIPGRQGKRQITKYENDSAASQGWMNFLYMKRRLEWLGHGDMASRIMPIHHQGEDLDVLKMMIDAGCEYVGISPSNDARTKQRMKYLDEVFGYLTSLPSRILTHGYAVTSETLMDSYPWFTVDSITWIYLAGFGVIKTPMGHFTFSEDPRSLKSKDNLRIVVDRDGDWEIQSAEHQGIKEKLRHYIEDELMMDVSVLAKDYWARAKANMLYFQNFQKTATGGKRSHVEVSLF